MKKKHTLEEVRIISFKKYGIIPLKKIKSLVGGGSNQKIKEKQEN